VRTHDELCTNPTEQFKALYSAVDLPWDDSVATFLAGHDRPGEGFLTERVAADLPESWRTRLSTHQISEVQRVLGQFPLTTWSARDLGLHDSE